MVEHDDGKPGPFTAGDTVGLDDLKFRIHRLLDLLAGEISAAASNCRRVLEQSSSTRPDREDRAFKLKRPGRTRSPYLETAKTLALIEKELARVLSMKKRFPLPSDLRRAPAGNLPEACPPSRRSGREILIVDDDPIILRLLSHFLGKSGYTVKTASDGAEGLAAAFAAKPDLILLDVMMPGMDGFRFLELLHQGEGLDRVPVFMISSMIDEDKVVQALDAGARDYIVKPFSSRIVLAKIRRVLRDLP
jgi:CheY-like chemotaxis protein